MERLVITKLLPLRDITLDVKPFMVITGDIAAGKSLIIKSLEFFSGIFTESLTQSYEKFIERLDAERFKDRLIKGFDRRFRFENNVLFDISYICSYGGNEFKIRMYRENAGDAISIDSKFLDSELNYWNDCIKNNKLESFSDFSDVRNKFSARISKKFNNLHPLVPTFIPASRAALAIGKGNFWDNYLMEYQDLIGYIKTLPNSKHIDEIHKILKAKIKINGDILLISDDNREVKLANASSGQQEAFFILLLLDKLPHLNYIEICKQHYIFIEEPEAHLFPEEQNRILKLIIRIFNEIRNDKNSTPVKFFITTHSPYVLDTINNMLKKGSIIKSHPQHIKRIEEEIEIPSLDADDFSAIFINADGTKTDILDPNEEKIFPEKIRDISLSIHNDSEKLSELNNELIYADQEN